MAVLGLARRMLLERDCRMKALLIAVMIAASVSTVSAQNAAEVGNAIGGAIQESRDRYEQQLRDSREHTRREQERHERMSRDSQMQEQERRIQRLEQDRRLGR